MPFTGGWSPSPERTGGGDGGSGITLLQRVFESIASARGDAYDQTLASIVGAENMAYARAICFEMYGGNVRLANQFNPATMTADGLLPRWEKIFNVPPNYGDTEPVRRARVAAAFARFVQPNSIQPVIDACSTALGALYQSLTLFDTTNALIWWPALGGGSVAGQTLYGACEVASVSGVMATITNLTGVPTAAGGAILTLSNCANAVNNGTWPVHDYVSSSSVKVPIPAGPVGPDYGVGGTSGAPTVAWSLNSPLTPFMSTIARVDVQCGYVSGYYTVVGGQNVPNAAYYQAVAGANAVLDELLPAWAAFRCYLLDQRGQMKFLLDEPNLDLEVLS